MENATSSAHRAHRDFLNRYYGISRHIYDLTRKYYLFGRDRVLDDLLAQPWSRLLEVGVGTGRNLAYLQRRRPQAKYAGLDACDEMLLHARRHRWLKTLHGFAEDADFSAPFSGNAPERILFSYSLSMMRAPLVALRRAQAALAPGGKVVFVDFADFRGCPQVMATAMTAWLACFHVRPLKIENNDTCMTPSRGHLRVGPLGYYVIGEYTADRCIDASLFSG